ncbi:MAG: hypothetical protein HY000_30460 [Planctomycetes bacterium]|nr:hypothetical protein [Planctomycetota bacterium]
MSTLGLAVVIAAVGIDTGWQPRADGRLEYILQLEPAVLEALRAGREVASDMPPTLRGVRFYRLTAGTSEVPRSSTPTNAAAVTPPGAFDITTLRAPPEQFGWQALAGGGFECILQLDSQRLDALAAGEELRGELPAFLQDVRTYRIRLGTQSLPRATVGLDAGAPAAAPQPAEASHNREASADVQPSLPSATSEATTGNSATPATVAQTAGYVRADPPDEAGSPSSVSPPLAAIIPQGLSWRDPYTFALIGLFTSVAMNLYLGWVTWNANHRYRTLRQQVVGDRDAAA